MQHIIQHHVFDIEFSDAGRSYELQDKISDIFNRQLLPRMEYLFDSLVPDDITFVLEDIHIDIGSISFNQLNSELPEKVLTELEKVIRESISLAQNRYTEATDAEPEIKTQEGRRIELLRFFLLTGTMPWWATDELATDPVMLAEYVLANNAVALKELILVAGKYDYVRRRMVHQFNDGIVRGIIALLEPNEAEFIFDYHASVTEIHRKDELIESAPNDEFEKALWLFILTYLLVDRGTSFNQKAFIQSTIAQMAQHYNRDYTQLLALLAGTLNNNREVMVQNSHLAMIIKELFSEELAGIQQPALQNISSNADEKVSSDLELVRYYLLFGSLPWWAEPFSAEGLTQLLLELTRKVPETLAKMIADIGQNEAVRMRITGTFSDEAVIAVVRALEPSGASFIIDYVDNVQSLHVKKAIIQTGNVDFRKTVWDIVLKFLLEQRGSEFNERMFLASNIKALAQNYNVAYSDILAYFVQSIGQLHQDSVLYVPLFRLLTDLIKDDKNTQLKLEGDAVLLKGDSAPAKQDNINRERGIALLRDVLLHWLTYGNIPWWGSKYFSWDAAAIFRHLLATSPADAALLLRFAGASAKTQQRVIYQVPFDLVINLFELYPQGNKAAELYEYFLAAIILGGDEMPESMLGAHRDLLLMTWNVLIDGQYRSFDQRAFLQTALDYSAQRSADTAPKLIALLRKLFTTAKREDYRKVLDKLVKINKYVSLDSLTYRDQEMLIEWLFTVQYDQNPLPRASHELLRLLDFLVNQKLSGNITAEEREQLEAKIKLLLSHFGDRDVTSLQQLLQKANKLQMTAFAGTNTSSSVSTVDIGQTIAEQDHTRGQLSKDERTRNVLKLLEDFLTYGELPFYLEQFDIHEVLKYMLTLLYYEKPAALDQLLAQTRHHPAARMALHDSFALPGNVAGSRIAGLLKPYAEADAIAYIKQASISGAVSSERLSELLAPFLAAPRKHGDFILTLLKRPGMIRHIAANSSDNALMEIAETHAGTLGGREEVSWLSEFRQFMKVSIADTLMRDEWNRLFNEFNLMILGGHISVHSRADYLKAFFAFILSRNNALYHMVSEVITRAVSDNKADSIKWLPQVAGQLRAHRKIQESRVAAEKQLTRSREMTRQRTIAADQPSVRIKPDSKQIKEELDKGRKQAEAAEKEQAKTLLADDKNAIYIGNAGLVLLNPFLSVYFTRLGLVEGGKFIDVEKQMRAVHLLQYVVTGATGSPEHQLVLNKILCNVPVEEPVPLNIEVTQYEQEVSEGMLNAVLNAWEKLKNTSIEGFRGSFLQRNGSLVYMDDAWNLRVEQRGYDVLLQTLPWTIGMIKAPWMDNFLYVEWT